MSNTSADQPGWKKWLVLAVFVLLVLLVIVIFMDPEGSDTAAGEDGCEEATPELVAAIEDGLTVDGGGTLENARMVPVPAEDRTGQQAWPEIIVAAEIAGEGMDGAVGAWGMQADNGGLLFALDPMAREFSEWGAAMGEGSPADQMRQHAEGLPQTQQARNCVEG